ncbi:BEN domain-containing protein 5-like [Chanos chanos]|uniref:BEN domain-containing protein 5-like n=1 Tax=Chanos chanos TaxID=29144 RepID=A0A6J2WCL6_CHACN|nr:BEN domain-containing protein 5-like [Chanos chanos]
MFALVRYLEDNYRDIVLVSHIKDFDPANVDDFDKTTKYSVLWRDDGAYYEGQVLLLSDKENTLRQRLESKRAPVPKIRTESATPPRKDRAGLEAAANKTGQDSGGADEGGMISQQVYEELLQGYQQLKRKKQRLAVELSVLQHKYAELEKAKEETQHELDEHKEECVNLRSIQDKIRSLLQGEALEVSFGAPVLPSPSRTSEETILQCPEGKTHIGGGAYIPVGTWSWIRGAKNDSRFCKDLAVAIWGSEVLLNRSTEGKVCNRLKAQGAVAKPPLTPEKYQAVKDSFKTWLLEKGVSESEVAMRSRKIGQYISEKIMDIKKAQKKF